MASYRQTIRFLLSAFLLFVSVLTPLFAQDGTFSGGEPLPSGSDLTANTGTDTGVTQGLRQEPAHRDSFFQSLTLEEYLVSPGSGDSLGVVHAGASAMFAAPAPGDAGTFLFSPTLATDHFYEMPNRLNMAENLYRTGLNVSWLYDVNDFWRVMLFVTPTYASDFKTHSDEAIRVPGGGMAIWTPSPNWQFSMGVLYTSLEGWSILPIGGVVWQPNETWRFEMTFPKPRVCRRMDAAWLGPLWAYAAGEFAGGSWAVELDEDDDLATYRELRFMLGVERAQPKIGQLNFECELGVSFCRKLYFEDSPAVFRPGAGLVQKLVIKF